jgi:hypothetical protein
MRAKEFITEREVGKPTKRQRNSSRGMHVFAKSNFDRIYALNRVMMAVASTDGVIVPDMDQSSWGGRVNTAHAYTEEEENMLKVAYKAMGISFKDLNHGDLKSEELTSINIKSPLKAFKGYKK